MTSIRLARLLAPALIAAVLASLLIGIAPVPIADARTGHVAQDDDDSWSGGEGRPHDWDSPNSVDHHFPDGNAGRSTDYPEIQTYSEYVPIHPTSSQSHWRNISLSLRLIAIAFWFNSLFSLRG